MSVRIGLFLLAAWVATPALAAKPQIWRGAASDISVSDKPDKTRRNVEKTIKAMAKQAKRVREGE